MVGTRCVGSEESRRAATPPSSLLYHGVSAERLMPVGYGEADANEAGRRLDRRVVVFRMR